MPDVRTYRNRLKLPLASARRIALHDISRIDVSLRCDAGQILLDHLANEDDLANGVCLIELLGEWKFAPALEALRELATDDEPKVSSAAKAALAKITEGGEVA